MKSKKVLMTLGIAVLPLLADSIEPNISVPAVQKRSDMHTNVENERLIVATGYGRDKSEALKHAFAAAIEQYIGIVIDSEAIVKNGKLIKNDILTASNGYIKSYDLLSQKDFDGLKEMKIRAVVRSQKLFSKIQALNINTISNDNAIGIFKNLNNTHARVTTKINSKEDAGKILAKKFKTLFEPETIKKLIALHITDVSLDEQKATKDKIPLYVRYEMTTNQSAYDKRIEALEQLFFNLGLQKSNRVDLPYIENGLLKVKNIDRVSKLKSTDIGIVKPYGAEYKLDVWSFPENWRDIYPFSSSESLVWNDIFEIILEIKKKNGSVLIADNISRNFRETPIITASPSTSSGYYSSGFKRNRAKILTPLFASKKVLTFEKKVILNIADTGNIGKITIEMEKK